MHVKGDLELSGYQHWELSELAEFVRLQPERVAVVRDPPEWTAPTRDGRESSLRAGWLGVDEGPLGEHDRLSHRLPPDVSGGDRAHWRANVLPHREVEMMVRELSVSETLLMPDLGIS